MSPTIVLLTRKIPLEERTSLASRLAGAFDPPAMVVPLDLASGAGIEEARHVLGTAQVDVALAYGGSPRGFPTESRVPVVVLAPNPNLMQIQADLVACLRARGVNASLVNSWERAIDRVRAILSPPVLGGKRVWIFVQPFDSATVPCRNLSQAYVRERTGVEVTYHPLEVLQEGLSQVDESKAQAEAERWGAGASEVTGATPEDILASSRLYLLLRDIVEREGLAGVSIDCVRYSFAESPLLPHPCLAFSRLRDEGIAAPCEADLPGMLSSLLVEGVSRKPSFFANVAAVDLAESTAMFLHCVVPLKMEGYEAEEMSYCLRDYHGLGRGVVPDVDFRAGAEVTVGAYAKDLRGFVAWPGIIEETGSAFCQNSAQVRIPDAGRFLQSVAGCHYVMVYGNHVRALADVLTRMNVSLFAPLIDPDEWAPG